METTDPEQIKTGNRETDEPYRLLFQLSSDAVFLLDGASGRCLDGNREAEHLTGYSITELKAQTADGSGPAGVMPSLRRLVAEQAAPDPREITFSRPDGSERTALIALIRLSDDLSLGIGRDVTGHRAREKRAPEHQVTSQNWGNLLAMVSHELRTPLAIVQAYSSFLSDNDATLDKQEREECFEAMEKATDRLTELVDHIQEMSSLESGTLALERAPAAIAPVVREAVAEARLRAPGYTIRGDAGDSLPEVRIDVRRIRQVLDNILDNAIKYSGEGTGITISVVPREQDLLVAVCDKGIGIPAGELEMVFERMYRIGNGAGGGQRGFGLGLTICRDLVEAHGGQIWIESVRGEGSTVFFTLPLQHQSIEQRRTTAT